MSNKETKNTVPFDEEESSEEQEEEQEEESSVKKTQKKSSKASKTPEPEAKEPTQEAETEEVPEEEKPKARAVSQKDVGIEYKKMSNEMKKHLDSQPKVQFLVPLATGEKRGAEETVQINGYRMVIKKGTMVTIPQQVAEILADHYRIQMEAGQEYKISSKGSDVEEALTE